MAGALKDQFVVGIVRGSHGITGEFKVESTSGEYEHFADMDEVTLTNGTVSRLAKVESVSEGSNILYMKLEGINSPEEAAKFNRWEIVVPREKAHKLQKDEWYIEDLKNCALNFYPEQGNDGLAVWTAPATGKPVKVGTITDVIEGGSGNLLEVFLAEDCDLLASNIKYSSEGKKVRTVYVPFNPQFVRNVDVKNKCIQLMHLWILE